MTVEAIVRLLRHLLSKHFRGRVILHLDGIGVPKIEVQTGPITPDAAIELF